MPTTPDLATTVAAVLMFNGRPIGTTSTANNPLVSAVPATTTGASRARTTGSESSFAEFRLLEHQYGQSLVVVDDNDSSKTHDAPSTSMSLNPQLKSISNNVQSDLQKNPSNCSASNSRTAKRNNINNHYNILATGASDRYRLIGAPQQTFIETVGNVLTGKTNASTNNVWQQQMSKATSHLITGSGDQTDLVTQMSASTSNGNVSSHSCSPTARPLLINHTQSTDNGCYSTPGVSTLSGPQLIFSSIIATQAKPELGAAKQQQQFSKPISSSPSSSSSSSKTKTSVGSPAKSSSVVASKANTSSGNNNSSNKCSNYYHHQHHNHASSTTSSLVSPMSDQAVKTATSASLTASHVVTASNSKQTTPSSTTGHQSPPAVAGQAVTARLMDMGKRLLDAAREGRTDQVRQLVVSSGAPFTSDWLGTTALHLAAQNGHAEIAEILLKGGVNRDARTKLERTALHLAAQGGSLEVVELLVNHGSDVNARDMLRMTPLHWAVERRHCRVVETLLLSGADLNAKSKFQLTPVEIAQNSEFYEILDLFKRWSTASSNVEKNESPTSFGCHLDARFTESHDMLDLDYHLELTHDNVTTSRASVLDIDEPCIDLVVNELDWNALKFEPNFFLSNDEEDEPKVEYLMKIVEELQQENRQLRQRVEQLSTTRQ